MNDYYNMYREVSELSDLNKLFSTLLSEKINVMNYKTNLKVEKQTSLIDTLDELDFLISDSLDNIKDLIKIKNGYPIYKLEDIELISNIKTHASQEYKEGSVIDNLKSEINIIVDLIKNIINKLNINAFYEVITVLSGISFNLKKILLEI